MLHVLELHSLSCPPGGDSSGCIEVYASRVKDAFSLMTTRGGGVTTPTLDTGSVLRYFGDTADPKETILSG